MDQPLRVLIIEDTEDDALLLVQELRRGGYEPTYRCVNNAETMKAALAEQNWQVVLADYSMPGFRALAVLALLQENKLDLPFIIILDTGDEDVAAAAMKAGAHDYLLKSNLVRLVPVVERELREAEMRRGGRQAIQALHDQELHFRALIEKTLDVIALVDSTSLITYASPAITRVLGYTPAEFTGRSATDFLHPDDFDEGMVLFQQLLQQQLKTSVSAQFRFRHKDGSWRWLEAIGTNLLAEPSVQAVVVNFHDITTRKQTEGELAQRAAHMAMINEIGRKIAALLDLDGVLHRAAHLVQQTFGYHHVALFLVEGELARLRAIAGSYEGYFPANHSQKLGQGIIGWVGTFGEKIVANDVSAEPRYISLIANHTVTEAELCLPIKVANQVVGILDIQSPQRQAFSENDVIAMETLTHQIAVAIENARLYEAVQRELTERKRVEAEIRRRNRELALLNQVIAASVIPAETEVVLQTACRELALIFGMSQAYAALFNEGKTEAVVVAEYFVDGATATLTEPQSTGLGQTLPVAANPILQYLLSHKAPLLIEDALHNPGLTRMRELIQRRKIASIFALPLLIEGEVVGGLELETTEPRHFLAEEVNLAWSVADQVSNALARARLAQTRERLIAAIEQAAESVIITDTEGAILYVNPAFEHVSGYSRTEIIGQNPRILKSSQQDEAAFKDMWATITVGQVWHGRFVNKRKDGALYTEDVTVAPVRNSSGKIVNYVSVQHDVTRELQLEEQYHQAQKMEAIGRLSGGIAHDFNNLLVVITGYSELLLQRHTDPNSTIYKYVEEIKKAGEQAALLTQQLLVFSRRQMLKPKVVNLNLVIIEVEQMLRRLIGEDIELVTVLAEKLGQVKADPGQIGQVIMNLVINARDAMPQGGKLIIETANIDVDKSDARQHFDLNPGLYVMLTISDTGVGMDEQTQAHIFEPFFTTKKHGQGTGLGLATVYGIVKQSGGYVWVYSKPGQGAVFKVYLPRLDEGSPSPSSKPDVSQAKPPGGVETVLVVEDEDTVRSLACQVLAENGYTVLAARHGPEALSLCEHYHEPLHLLVTDVVMPQMSGHELAQHLLQLRPELKVLYISGYTDEALVYHGILEAGLFFLQKPFTPNTLAGKVREVLDTPVEKHTS